jgi:hypothetical protein
MSFDNREEKNKLLMSYVLLTRHISLSIARFSYS